MATRPTGSTTGAFFDYPSDATGQVLPYWLASSPGSGHRVRMTGACKRAFLATIEAVIERAVAPATCGNVPASGADMRAATLDSSGTGALIPLGDWSAPAGRAALGGKFARGCPKEEWERLVQLASLLWSGVAHQNGCGTVYSWQMEMLAYQTDGFIEEEFGWLPIGDMNQVMDVVSYFADESSRNSLIPELRPWGGYPGGTPSTSVTNWVVLALTNLGAHIDSSSGNFECFAESQLNGSPAPLIEGHEGNWFGSTSSAMVGPSMSARRSSSAWAVLQAMLANMRFTHLLFPYEHNFNQVVERRTVLRHVTMDVDTGDIYAVEEYDRTQSESSGVMSHAYANANQSFSEDFATRQVKFRCSDADAANLAVSVRPADGWSRLGTALVPYLEFGSVTHTGDGLLEFTHEESTGIDSVDAGVTEHEYPAVGMRNYVDAYGAVTFVDREDVQELSSSITRYSVRAETGGADLRTAVRSHATWILARLPAYPFPTIAPCPGTLVSATRSFWDGWEVYYPPAPNIQVGGQDAFFPVEFRNDTFYGPTNIPISHGSNGWESPAGYECVFGGGRMAFPDLGTINYGFRSWEISGAGQAMAAHTWRFKAMSA